MNSGMLRSLCLLAVILTATADVSHVGSQQTAADAQQPTFSSVQEGSDDWPALDLPPLAGWADEGEECEGRQGPVGHRQTTARPHHNHNEPQFLLPGRIFPPSFAFPHLRRAMQASAAAPSPATSASADWEEDNATLPGYFFLAQNETKRANPLNQLKVYTDGWNPTNEDYWAATAWTAVYAPIIGILWIFLGVFVVIFFVILRMCCTDRYHSMFDKRPTGYGKLKLYIPLGISVFGCCMAIAGFCLLVTGGLYLRSNLWNIGQSTEQIANATASFTYRLATLVESVAELPAAEAAIPDNVRNSLILNAQYINNKAQYLNSTVGNSRQTINRFSYILVIMLVCVGSVSVALTLAAITCGLCRWVTASNVFITVIWIFTLVSWLLVMIFLVVSLFFLDTSVAMNQVAVSPTTLTVMNDWVPCLNRERIGRAVRFAASTSIFYLNQTIAKEAPRVFKVLRTSGLCNPFGPPRNYTYDRSLCAPDTISVKQLSRVIINKVCPSGLTTCIANRTIPVGNISLEVENATQAIDLLFTQMESTFPGIMMLLNCSFVQKIANYASQMSDYLRSDSLFIWLGYTLIAVGSMLLAIALPLHLYWAVRSAKKQYYEESEEQPMHDYDPGSLEPSKLDSGISDAPPHPSESDPAIAVPYPSYTTVGAQT